jgi:hypothetical protein
MKFQSELQALEAWRQIHLLQSLVKGVTKCQLLNTSGKAHPLQLLIEE